MRSILSNFSSKVGIGVANKENIVGDDLGDNSVGTVDELDVNIKHTEASVIETDDLKKRPRLLLLLYYRQMRVVRKHLRTALSRHFQGVMDAHVAEAVIMRKALSWIKDSNCDQIVIELDCMEVFNALGQASSRVSEFVRVALLYASRINVWDLIPSCLNSILFFEFLIANARIRMDIRDRSKPIGLGLSWSSYLVFV
ncbi:hypothetical protein Goshw_015796 [Gossypium schwendimanii]|uniref:RNase H type-1 domain-containing protein n=1 Tax=Gossypium schwendimanii TaxID=34291 RepID=A0A7J9KSM6_GOSSC|nr:hypothetical protein [Gossypium schwendimanii]